MILCLLSILTDKIYNLYQFSRLSVYETKDRVWVFSLFVCLVLWSLSKKIGGKKGKRLKLFCHVQTPNPRFVVFRNFLNIKMPSSVKKKIMPIRKLLRRPLESPHFKACQQTLSVCHSSKPSLLPMSKKYNWMNV